MRNGYCLALALREFIKDPYPEDKIGKMTPWRFVHYTYTEGVVPDPVKYRESLENSFSGATLRRFARKLYQCLLLGHLPFKCRKPCVIGDSDSGKNSWFAPIEAIIGMEDLAFVTKEGKFSMSMINEETKCIVIEEWTKGKKVLKNCISCYKLKHFRQKS